MLALSKLNQLIMNFKLLIETKFMKNKYFSRRCNNFISKINFMLNRVGDEKCFMNYRSMSNFHTYPGLHQPATLCNLYMVFIFGYSLNTDSGRVLYLFSFCIPAHRYFEQ